MPRMEILTRIQRNITEYGKARKISQKQFALWGVAISLLLILSSILPTRTLISLFAFFFFLYSVIKLYVKEFKEKGLLHYIPESIRQTILKRSLFDFLCDMWFVPKISGYLKLVVTPFFVKLPPDQAISYLDDLDSQTRRTLLTKGIINILPDNLKNVLLPKTEQLKLIDQEVVAQPPTTMMIKLSKESSQINETEISTAKPPSETFTEEELTSKQRGFSFLNSNNEGDSSPISKSKPRPSSKPKTFLEDVNTSTPKTQVILSSAMFYNNNQQKIRQHPLVERWDRLDLLASQESKPREVETYRKGSRPTDKSEKSGRPLLVGPLKIVQQLLDLKDKLFLVHLTRTENKTLFKALAGANVLLIIQLLMSKKARGWFRNTFLFIVYLASILITIGASGIMALKYFKKKKKDQLENDQDENE